MPTPLWQAVLDENYAEVGKIIKNPELNLVNEMDEDQQSLIQVLLTSDNVPLSLFQLILTHEKFNPNYKNIETEETNIDSIISIGRMDLVEIFAKNSRLLLNDEKLSLETAKKEYMRSKTVLEMEARKGVNAKPESLNRAKGFVDTFEKITTLLRDLTILHAIKNDDVTLFDRLEKAEANPAGKLSNGKAVEGLIADKPNLSAWFKARAPKPSASTVTLMKIQEADNLQAQIDALKANHATNTHKAQTSALGGLASRFAAAFKI